VVVRGISDFSSHIVPLFNHLLSHVSVTHPIFTAFFIHFLPVSRYLGNTYWYAWTFCGKRNTRDFIIIYIHIR